MAEDDSLSIAIYKANLINQLGGQIFIDEIEMENAGRELAAPSGDEVPFFRLPFREAVEHFMSKRLVTAEEFETLSDAERMRSFSVGRASSNTLIKKMKRAMDQMLGDARSTASMRDFINRFRDQADGFTSSYLENVVRTTSATSYNSGRLRAQKSPRVVSKRPFLQYLTAGDARVRESHAKLHRRVWRHDEFPSEIYPPNGYNCRCVVITRTEEQAKRFPSGRGVSLDGVTQEGFAAAPDQVVEQEASLDASAQSSLGAR